EMTASHVSAPDANATEETVKTGTPELTQVSEIAVSQAQPQQAVAIQRSRRRTETPTLNKWDLATLKKGGDPLGKALVIMMEKGVTSALFLAVTAPPKGGQAQVPHFNAKSALASPDKLQQKVALWSGMHWD